MISLPCLGADTASEGRNSDIEQRFEHDHPSRQAINPGAFQVIWIWMFARFPQRSFSYRLEFCTSRLIFHNFIHSRSASRYPSMVLLLFFRSLFTVLLQELNDTLFEVNWGQVFVAVP